jgi:hypothetical protein
MSWSMLVDHSRLLTRQGLSARGLPSSSPDVQLVRRPFIIRVLPPPLTSRSQYRFWRTATLQRRQNFLLFPQAVHRLTIRLPVCPSVRPYPGPGRLRSGAMRPCGLSQPLFVLDDAGMLLRGTCFMPPPVRSVQRAVCIQYSCDAARWLRKRGDLDDRQLCKTKDGACFHLHGRPTVTMFNLGIIATVVRVTRVCVSVYCNRAIIIQRCVCSWTICFLTRLLSYKDKR